MFLLILESIGTQELVIIGLVALMFLGPRKLPEYAKKIGKMMADFRSTTSEFKETWQREVNFEEEARALRLDDIDEDDAKLSPGATAGDSHYIAGPVSNLAPEVKTIDREEFEKRLATAAAPAPDEPLLPFAEEERGASPSSDKRNWF